VGDRGARREEGPVEVGGEDAAPVGWVDVRHRGHPGGDPGVGDGYVEVAEEGERFGDHALDGPAVAHVRLHDRGAPGEGADLLGRPLGGLAIAPVVDRHVGALARELEDDPTSDAAATAGDERRLVREPAHGGSTPNAPPSTRRSPARSRPAP
jgi:hypothetical protein